MHYYFIDKEKIDTYRHAYQDSAAVKTTLAQRMFANGTTKLFDGDTEIDDVSNIIYLFLKILIHKYTIRNV